MAVESSKDLPLGTRAPDFALPDTVSGRTIRLGDYAASPALLVAFICNHCPYVQHMRAAFVEFAREFQPRGLAVVAISANDPEAYPQDSPEQMAIEAKKSGFTFPYLFDRTQQTAKAYHAVCTPEFYLFDAAQRLVYRGRFDASRPNSQVPITGSELRAAAEAVLAGRQPAADQKPSIGCGIKWRPGNAPSGY
ncbi:MAG: thioredoxin family protein [Betaproteobacteria bacterium]|nr:MAG: thioredoxin family protein [Betaproteobacteria bacterium]